MKPSRSLTLLALSITYLLMVEGLDAANTVDCVDCIETTGATGNQITLANAGTITSTVVNISANATNLGCTSIRTNRNFSMIKSGLKFAGYTPEDFFQHGTCTHHIGNAGQATKMTPLQLAIREPISRKQMILELLKHLDSLGDQNLVRDILNHGNSSDPTILDYIEDLYNSGSSSAQSDFDDLRDEFCKRGGIYRVSANNCTTSA